VGSDHGPNVIDIGLSDLRDGGRLKDIRAFIESLFARDLHAKRVDLFAAATLGDCAREHALDGNLTGQNDWLTNYAERHRAGLKVGTAITQGTANCLVNRRMNKSQPRRWSPRGADLLLQVRCALHNGTLGSNCGQRLKPANDPLPPLAIAA
jgi:hypothetical protein